MKSTLMSFAENGGRNKEMRNVWLDVLRTIAPLGVILIHLPINKANSMAIINGAVPLFSILAGYLLQSRLGEVFCVKSIVMDRVKRLGVPYLFWAVVYWIMNDVVLDLVINKTPFHCISAMAVAKKILTGSMALHLWFLPTLFYAQAWLILGMGVFTQKRSRAIFLMFTSMVSMYTMIRYSATWEYFGYYFSRLFCFHTIGALFAFYEKKIFWSKGTWLKVLTFAGWGGFLLGYGLLLTGVVKGVQPFLLIVPSLFISALALNYWYSENKHSSIKGMIVKISKLSMGVYLVHVFFVFVISVGARKLGYSSVKPWIGISTGIIIYILSAYVSFVALKIPYLRRVIV